MKFGEALSQSRGLKKDLVLRQIKATPPVCKIMNYKMQLLKRLFKKLGKDMSQNEVAKTKTIRLSTTISVHDLENKKNKAIADFKKENLILKFFMKCNVYDKENVQKGKLMLLNLAEDLKEHAKMKVSPSGKKAD